MAPGLDGAVRDDAVLGVPRQGPQEAVLVRGDVDDGVDQVHLPDLGVLHHGEQAPEDGVVLLPVPVVGHGPIGARGGDGQVVEGVAVAVQLPGEGQRHPIFASHVDVVGELVGPRRVLGDAQQARPVSDGHRGPFFLPVYGRADAQQQQGAQHGGKESFHISLLIPSLPFDP